MLDGGLLLARAAKGVLARTPQPCSDHSCSPRSGRTVTNRARHGQAARADAALYVDECHNFLTLPRGLSDLLAEARARRFSVTLAHQDLAQFPRELREAISANARPDGYGR